MGGSGLAEQKGYDDEKGKKGERAVLRDLRVGDVNAMEQVL